MGRQLLEPIELPAAVWADPAVLALCAAHDAGGLFRLVKRYGVSNERLAYWTGADAAEVSRRLHGKAGRVTALRQLYRPITGTPDADVPVGPVGGHRGTGPRAIA